MAEQQLREALQAAEKFLDLSINVRQSSPDELPDYASQWDYDAALLVSMIRDALALPASPAPMTDGDIIAKAHRMCWKYKFSSDLNHSSTYTFNDACLIDFIRAILASAPGGAVPEWRPIETAPKGRLVLLAGVMDHDSDWRIKVGGWWDEKWNIFGAGWKPLRWMPLPSAPTSPAAGDSK